MSKQNGNEDFLAELITKACGKAVYLHICAADFPRALTESSTLKTITMFLLTILLKVSFLSGFPAVGKTLNVWKSIATWKS